MAHSVGILNEGHLHASLKAHYLEAGDRTEVRVDGYIADILRGDTIIEIQTGNFSSIARKMRDLVTRHRVRLVHPVPRDRWIVKMPADGSGAATTRRKSPQHLGAVDVFRELVSFPELIAHENFELDIVLIEEETVWLLDSARRRRRHGWVTVQRRLVQVYETVRLRGRADCVPLIPAGLPAEFLTSDLARAINRPRRVAQQMAYCLRKAGMITQVGSQGNAALYAVVEDPVGARASSARKRVRSARAKDGS